MLFDSMKDNTILKDVVCLTDRDPERKINPDGKFKKCYPYEYNQDTTKYTYQTNPNAEKYPAHPNITFYSQDIEKGKTFEYEILLSNPTLELLLTDSISNEVEIKALMTLYSTDGKTAKDLLDRLNSSDENTRIKDSINANVVFNDEEKKKAIIASRYLNSVGKGENALELSYVLLENFKKEGTPDYKKFIVPEYIKNAIEKLCQ